MNKHILNGRWNIESYKYGRGTESYLVCVTCDTAHTSYDTLNRKFIELRRTCPHIPNDDTLKLYKTYCYANTVNL